LISPTKTVSVRNAMRLTLGGSLTLLICLAVALHEYGHARDLRLWESSAASALGHGLAIQFRADREWTAAQLHSACERALEVDGVHAIAVLNQRGEPLARAARDGNLEAIISSNSVFPPAAPEIEGSRVIAARQLSPASVGHRTEIPLGRHPDTQRPGRLVLQLAGPLAPSFAGTDLLTYHVPLILAMLLVTSLSAWWLRREVLRPLRRLALVARSDEGVRVDSALTHRKDEIGAIARAMNDLRGSLIDAQERTTRIERSIPAKVAEETRRIELDLKRTQRDAFIDPLTGAWNRRALDARLTEMYHACRDAGDDFTVAMVDLDHFKHLNDTLGHATGDELLAFAGQLIRRSLRTTDFVVRYGGDEFVLLLPNVSAERAATIIDRIRALFAQRTRALRLAPSPTISAGIASIVQNHPTGPAELLCLADRALYTSKRAGKNGLAMHPPCCPMPPRSGTSARAALAGSAVST